MFSNSLVRKTSVKGAILFIKSVSPLFPALLSCYILNSRTSDPLFSHFVQMRWFYVLAHRAPPQSISIGGKVLVVFFLHQVNQERGEDQHQEPDVPGSHQLLQHTHTHTNTSTHSIDSVNHSVRISEPAPVDICCKYFAVICSIDEYFIRHHGNLWALQPTHSTCIMVVKNLLCVTGLNEPANCWCMFRATQLIRLSGSGAHRYSVLLSL